MGKKEQNLAFVNSLCIYLLLVQLYSDLRGPPVPVVHRPRTTKHCGPPRPTDATVVTSRSRPARSVTVYKKRPCHNEFTDTCVLRKLGGSRGLMCL